MRTSTVTFAGILALAAAAYSGPAAAASLTRSNCWTANFDSGATRTICFSGERRATMRNRNRVNKSETEWSRCEWTGDYFSGDGKVIVVFAQNSGKCSNRANSPQWTAVCDFDGGDTMECRGASIVDGAAFEFSGTFK